MALNRRPNVATNRRQDFLVQCNGYRNLNIGSFPGINPAPGRALCSEQILDLPRDERRIEYLYCAQLLDSSVKPTPPQCTFLLSDDGIHALVNHEKNAHEILPHIETEDDAHAAIACAAGDFDLTTEFEDDSLLLHQIVVRRSPNIVRFALEGAPMGGFVNARDGLRKTPLHILAENLAVEATLEAARVLLDHGAKVNVKDAAGNTPLHCAVMVDHGALVAELIERGADVNVANAQGSTALHLAARDNRGALVKTFLWKKADVLARDAQGRTPRDVAAAAGRVELAAELTKFEQVMQLQANPAPVGERSRALG